MKRRAKLTLAGCLTVMALAALGLGLLRYGAIREAKRNEQRHTNHRNHYLPTIADSLPEWHPLLTNGTITIGSPLDDILQIDTPVGDYMLGRLKGYHFSKEEHDTWDANAGHYGIRPIITVLCHEDRILYADANSDHTWVIFFGDWKAMEKLKHESANSPSQ